MRTIGFLIYPGFQILDLTGPLAAFQTVTALGEPDLYRTMVLSADGGPILSTAGVEVASQPATRIALDTLVVAGGRVTRGFGADDVAAVGALARRARRVTSVCTGAFLLAEAGLLDGRRATTHWRFSADLQRAFPRLRVEGDAIFVRDGTVWTSAGITAGIDLALALIEEDHGGTLAKAVARELVVPYRRQGGQSQYSQMLALEPETGRIRRALVFAREHLGERLDVERLAEVACLGPRQFSRAFRAETGETPAKAIERLRIETARAQLVEGTASIERVAAITGFGDVERMRRAFVRQLGQPPQALRRAAGLTRPRRPGKLASPGVACDTLSIG